MWTSLSPYSGATNYAWAVLSELITLLHRVGVEVRQKVERFISYKGQGLDATLEERHSNVKALVGRGGLVSFRMMPHRYTLM
jgi:hypothetical protein